MASQSLIQIADFLNIFDLIFENLIPERLKCIICKLILKNAKQTSCGCKVCEKCIIDLLRDGERPCPECQEGKLKLGRDIHQDNATNKEIATLRAKCPFKSCEIIDMLKSLLSHVENCDFREILCPKCSKKYPFKEKVTHDNTECEERMVKCRFCTTSMTAREESTIHLNVDHGDLCSKYVGNCPNECGTKNVLIKDHLKSCLNQRLECPFNNFVCKVGKLTKVKLKEHLDDEMISHFSNLVSEFKEIKLENVKLSDITVRLKKLLTEQMNITEKLTESRIKIDRSIEDLKKKTPGSSLSTEKNVIFRNGSFIWKITNFETLKIDAESGGRASTTSDPFYTSEFGYKMCLRVYPAGDGVGRGSHLSVFFAIMKGDFDDLLSWPFKQKVTLSLLDQENTGSKNHSDTFKPDARSACYQKPMDDCNIASGSPKFIALSSLFPNSIYYKCDTIYLKISVDTIGITKP